MKVSNSLLVLFAALFILSACAGTDPDYDNVKRKEISVRQTDRGVEVTVNESILFANGKYELKPESRDVLDRVSTILRDRTRKDILIEGYTDNVGSLQFNQRLSEKRANAVKNGLIEREVAASRMKAVGLGVANPVASNDTPEGRQLNRRTQIVLAGETTENIGGDSAIMFLMGAVARLKEMGNAVRDLFRQE